MDLERIESAEEKQQVHLKQLLSQAVERGSFGKDLKKLSNDQLKKLSSIIWEESKWAEYVCANLDKIFTWLQRKLGTVFKTFMIPLGSNNRVVQELIREAKVLSHLSIKDVNDEMERRGMIKVVRVGINYSARQYQITSPNGGKFGEIGPDSGSPEQIMEEAKSRV